MSLESFESPAIAVLSGWKPLVPPSQTQFRFKSDRIISAVLKVSGFTFEEIRGPNRAKALVVARHVLMWLIRKHCPNLSCISIGDRLNRDHTSVLYASVKIDRERNKAKFAELIDAVEALI